MGIALFAANDTWAGPIIEPITVLGLEITQAIQSLDQVVPLLRGKRTVVRLYLEPPASLEARVQAEISVSNGVGNPASYVAAINRLMLSPAHAELREQRRNGELSLNFILPQTAVESEQLEVEVKRIFTATGDLPFAGAVRVVRPLVAAPVLRIRAVGLRYLMTEPDGTGVQVSPEAFHFDRLRSFLLRTYPVAAVEWSQIVVQAHPLVAPPFSGPPVSGDDVVWRAKLNLAHAQLAALRAKDVDGGIDPRTHYYGLISDKGGFFRGAAKDIPGAPDPTVVAVGPAGDPSRYPALEWDTDPSFADWYGAHELGHTFGRFHPGFCGQDASDPNFPNASGRISDDALGDMVGFDVGDAALGLPLRAMPHERCHDVMTYCSDQWMSAYSYEAILARLRAEDEAFGS